jgi:RNA polymerase sigma factor (sigma-70 family)
MSDESNHFNSPGDADQHGGKGRIRNTSGVMSMRCDNWMFGNWQNSELQGSYIREVASFPMLSPEQEYECTKNFSEARSQMRRLVNEFPQMIFAKIRELVAADGAVRLSNYMDLELDENNVYSTETIEQLSMNVLRNLLGQEALIIAEIERERANATAGVELDLPKILAQFLQDGICRTQFRQRFYTESAQMFINGKCAGTTIDNEHFQKLREEMQLYSSQADEAMKALVEGNLRLVISIARRYNCSLLSLSDLVQEGNIGLMRAVESFEYKRGHRFSTYASYWVRQSISHAINSLGRPIRMPINILRQIAHIRKAERDFLQENGRMAETDELAKILDMSTARIRSLQKMAQQPISLQSVASEDCEWGELLADDAVASPHDEYNRDAIRNSLRMALNTLDDREREIIIRRFGIMGQQMETLDQIAARFKLTSERIRQIESAALRKLRAPKANQFLDELRSH